MDLCDELDDSRIECPLTYKWYIPQDKLHQLIVPKKVQEYMDAPGVDEIMPDYETREKYVVSGAMKVFAILVLIGRSNPIHDILSNKLKDDHLPLARDSSSDRRRLVSVRSDAKFQLPENWKNQQVAAFLEKQWLFEVPVFDTSGRHLNLHGQCALPLKKPLEPIGMTESSRVYTCEIHPAHYRGDSSKCRVAIKEIWTEEYFQREQKNLVAIQSLNNPHLIKHLVTCQRGTIYYVVFPLANGGSLLSYWEQKSEVKRTGELVVWALKQMLGLASATHALHYGFEGQVNCRHGDLKPANILHFEGDGVNSLVIADLGVSSIHDRPTNLRFGETMTKATTRAYEAPEAYDVDSKELPRSRTYDVWSLGCVFLEFTIWFLYGFDAIKSFECRRRRCRENPYASFYELDADGKARILGVVKQGIDDLKDDSRLAKGSSLRDLVCLIENKLLVTLVESRFNAKELLNELQRIVQRIEKMPLKSLSEAGSAPPTPEIFRPYGAHNA